VDELIRDPRGRPLPIDAATAARIRQQLVQQGYDAIIVRDGGGDGIDYVVALVASTVKVVRP